MQIKNGQSSFHCSCASDILFNEWDVKQISTKKVKKPLSSPRCLRSRPSTEKTEAKQREEVERARRAEEVYVEERQEGGHRFIFTSPTVKPHFLINCKLACDVLRAGGRALQLQI